jgi:transcriptional regulator with XRE-family HTH domain
MEGALEMRLDLKLAILRIGKTQRQIALELDIPENRLSELVRGLVLPREGEREALARALDRSPDELFSQPGRDEVHIRGVLDGLQSAIIHADAFGCDDLVNTLGTLKLEACRLFSGLARCG